MGITFINNMGFESMKDSAAMSAGEVGELGVWRWAEDSWLPNPDNQAHFAIGLGLYFMFVHLYLAEWISVIITIFLEVAWQIKDGLVPVDYKTGEERKDIVY